MSSSELDQLKHVHVPTPLTSFSGSHGNAITTVTYELVRASEALGTRCGVVLHRRLDHDLTAGTPLLVDFPQVPFRRGRQIDVLLGALGFERRNWARHYAPVVQAVGVHFDRTVVLHNAVHAVPSIRRRLPKAQLVSYAHNELFRTYTRREVRRVLGDADLTIAVSGFLADRLASGVPALRSRIEVVLNGVDTQRFHPPPSPAPNPRPRVMFVGRVAPHKGPHLLVAAALELARRGVDFELMIVGSHELHDAGFLDDYEQQLRRTAAPIADRTTFAPFCPRAALPDLLRTADVFVFPSDCAEACGLALLEGMATGLACVATRRGGIPEVGENAVLYAAADGASIADRLEELLSDEGFMLQMGRRARARALQLDWSTCAAAFLDACHRA